MMYAVHLWFLHSLQYGIQISFLWWNLLEFLFDSLQHNIHECYTINDIKILHNMFEINDFMIWYLLLHHLNSIVYH